MATILCASFGPVSSNHAEESDSQAESPRRPNIVFILADDLGYADLAATGSTFYETPHIDALVKQGLRFTSAYTNAPNCAPTRAALMSGRQYPGNPIYTVASGARGAAERRKLIPVENETTLPKSFFTMAEALQAAGYRTCHLGKWHLGSPGEAGPREQGFDVNIGGNHSGSPAGGYFSPYKNKQLKSGPAGEYLTDRLGDEAVKFIEKNQDQPFFLYLAFHSVHTPIQAKPELRKKYASKQPAHGHHNPAYAGMIESLDASVGKVTATLDRLKLADNTVVIFYSDNGGLGGYGADARNITANFPLRGGKGMLYEGGIRVPLVVRYPPLVPANTICDTPVIGTDFYPTLLELSDTRRAPNLELDGVSIVPLLKDPASDKLPRTALTWHFPGYLQGYGTSRWRTTPAGAIRMGDYKLIEFFEDQRVELYDLSRDPGEQHDLAEKLPKVAGKLHRALLAWRAQVEAPMPRPKS